MSVAVEKCLSTRCRLALLLALWASASARADETAADKQDQRWAKVRSKLELMRSSLENFTPRVRPGDQSELGTWARPFAEYLARMHRQIHKFWGFGFLDSLSQQGKGPYNDLTLVTALEIAVRADGTVDRIIVSRPSGVAGFDATAMEAVMSASPFPAPPPVIKSRDGLVHVTWPFHRDGRQCATDFVEPHTLTTPGSPPPSNVPQVHRPPPSAVPPVAGVPEGARIVAQKWLAAFLKDDARWLAGFSALPFVVGGKTVAQDGEGLRALYRQVLVETAQRSGTLSYFTQADIRKKLGRLPPGGDEDGMVFALWKNGTSDLLLIMQEADRGWRVVGIDR